MEMMQRKIHWRNEEKIHSLSCPGEYKKYESASPTVFQIKRVLTADDATPDHRWMESSASVIKCTRLLLTVFKMKFPNGVVLRESLEDLRKTFLKDYIIKINLNKTKDLIFVIVRYIVK